MTDAPLVVDASVAIKWVIPGDGSIRAAALRSRRLFAPDLLLAECAQTLWREFRRRALSRDDVFRSFLTLRQAPISWTPTGDLVGDAIAIATVLNHSVYDCVYVALARSLSTPLVTVDAKLVAAARRNPRLAELVRSLTD
ncbi:MAG: type II toxin-antitoxin system VapC family toxin [Alphaproteobacteria bacterium]|nr:type II toxin-antitoxin system VapC family toxin [Alphaproteobacteria bacterium]